MTTPSELVQRGQYFMCQSCYKEIKNSVAQKLALQKGMREILGDITYFDTIHENQTGCKCISNPEDNSIL